jgi:hypothetical protein
MWETLHHATPAYLNPLGFPGQVAKPFSIEYHVVDPGLSQLSTMFLEKISGHTQDKEH